jgi:predicted lipoprotein with Yx(FWY)xxD motif
VFHTDPVVEAGVSPFAVFASDGGADASDPDAQAPASDGGGSIDGSSEAGSLADASGEGGPRPEGGTPRDAGDAGPAPSITVLNNPFVGNYLADSAGRTLYTYGADWAGDCNYAPISNCVTDCLVAWPLFNANPRTLAPSLDDHAFGTILRADGAYQTTYFGWPLYYYKTDTGPGVLGGQAKAKTWHAATVIPLGIFIMKGTTAVKYLGDGAGHTLYVYDADTKGTATSDPTSACADACLTMHPAFRRNRISVVSSLEPTDFTIFVQGPLGQQVAYKGAPLYYSSDDLRSGDQKGATTPGWSIAIP